MSNVLQRFRKISPFQPLVDSRKLRGMIINWAMNDKNIPKRKRILFVGELKDLSNKLVETVNQSHECFPNSKEKLAERKKYLANAIRTCDELFEEFQFIDDVQHLNLDRLSDILELLMKISESLSKCKSSNKVISDDKSVTIGQSLNVSPNSGNTTNACNCNNNGQSNNNNTSNSNRVPV